MTGTTPVRTLSVCVVICAYTCDRWDDVLAAVASVRSQRTAPEEIVVVVDHNPDLYSRLRPVLPDVTVVENRYQRGLSGGKNTGVEVTSSDVVAFLDDDAVAHPDWLGHLRDAYADDCIVGVGGTTLPLWESARPRWFPEEFDWVLGCTFTGQGTRAGPKPPGRQRLLPSRGFLGGRWVPEPTSAGPPRSSRPLGCEETEFCIRVSQHRPDWTFVFEPRAVIWHRVPAARERFDLFPLSMLRRGIVEGGRDAQRGRRRRALGRAAGTPLAPSRAVWRGGSARHCAEIAPGSERSCAIAVGLLAAAAGYARGGVSLRRRPAMTGAE